MESGFGQTNAWLRFKKKKQNIMSEVTNYKLAELQLTEFCYEVFLSRIWLPVSGLKKQHVYFNNPFVLVP